MSAVARAPAGMTADPFDVRLVRGGHGMLRDFNHAGVLAAADVHVAARLAELAGERGDAVILALALAVRAPRLGHVHVDLARVADTVVLDAEEAIDSAALPWPAPESWLARVSASKLVTVQAEHPATLEVEHPAGPLAATPFSLIGSWLYLDRYLREERLVAHHLRALSRQPAGGVSLDGLADGLARLLGHGSTAGQRLAGASALLRRLTVIAGGPGTGKTTTVAAIVALLYEQAAGGQRPPLIALAAPTGKAAARLQEAVHEQAAKLPVSATVAGEMMALRAFTLHRLLARADARPAPAGQGALPLPYDVVIVDETSMVSLSLMARLARELPAHARLILVGDPGQLTSIEAGAVLGDIVGAAAHRPRMTRCAQEKLAGVTGIAIEAEEPPEGVTVADGIVVLDHVHRFGATIAALAAAVRRGDDDAVLELLSGQPRDVRWVDARAGHPLSPAPLQAVRDKVIGPARAMFEAAAVGDADGALRALARVRILCAHRHGAQGAATWNERVRDWLVAELGGLPLHERWYAGRPLLVTENDYDLGLYNGDTGVIIQTASGRLSAAFARGGEIVEYGPARLRAAQTVYAMTIHKSQGSQVDAAAVLLAEVGSPILTRELLYTAVTRAREQLLVIADEAAIRAAVRRPVARASGLGRWLWQPTP